MQDFDFDNAIIIVTGVSLRGEEMDRPLAYRLAEEIKTRTGPESPWRALVVSDVLYLNEMRLAGCPTISVGGPGVNKLSAILFRELPAVLTIDNVLILQMDVDCHDLRCCFWGINHDQTVEALDLFIKLGHLDHFLAGVQQDRIA